METRDWDRQNVECSNSADDELPAERRRTSAAVSNGLTSNSPDRLNSIDIQAAGAGGAGCDHDMIEH